MFAFQTNYNRIYSPVDTSLFNGLFSKKNAYNFSKYYHSCNLLISTNVQWKKPANTNYHQSKNIKEASNHFKNCFAEPYQIRYVPKWVLEMTCLILCKTFHKKQAKPQIEKLLQNCCYHIMLTSYLNGNHFLPMNTFSPHHRRGLRASSYSI